MSDHKRLPYEGPDGISEILSRLTRFGWQPIKERDNTIALSLEGCAITLEPGGQFELSGAPLETIHQTCDEVHTHLAQVKEVGEELGIGMLGLGFDPSWPRDEIPWMPKGRYSIMKRWMQEVGTLGLDMMLRTCTVQTNLDFSHEGDMVQKYRISLALQPLATALFANSPFHEGKLSNYLSLRSNVWTDTDPYRCGMLPFVFEDGYGFERHVDYILDVPMYFVYRDGIYHDVAGKSFSNVIRYQNFINSKTQIGLLASNRYYEGDAYGNLYGFDALFNFSDVWKFEFEVFINNNKEPDADWIDSDKKFGDYSVRLDGEKLSGNAVFATLRRDTETWRSYIEYSQLSLIHI